MNKILEFSVRTPKRNPKGVAKQEERYPYYAGYSENFADDALRLLAKGNARVLDPWNGAGTTSAMCRKLGLSSISFDLNPVMVVVARARLATDKDFSIARVRLQSYLNARPGEFSMFDGEPLVSWLGVEAANSVRYLMQKILRVRSTKSLPTFIQVAESVSRASTWQCLLILSIYGVIKTFTSGSLSSNPTWVKKPSSNVIPIVDFSDFETRVLDELNRLGKFQIVWQRKEENSCINEIFCGASEDLRIPDTSIDLVLTSPPYCTRIDYAAATRVELAVMGLTPSIIDAHLRRQLLGSTANREEKVIPEESWGETCNEFLLSVKNHPSHGSRTYYYYNFSQYFGSLYRSIVELQRVLKEDGIICAVLQGSYYKEHLIDLPLIFTEMAQSLNMEFLQKKSFEVYQYFGNINTQSRKYRNHRRMDEQVLLYRKRRKLIDQ